MCPSIFYIVSVLTPIDPVHLSETFLRAPLFPFHLIEYFAAHFEVMETSFSIRPPFYYLKSDKRHDVILALSNHCMCRMCACVCVSSVDSVDILLTHLALLNTSAISSTAAILTRVRRFITSPRKPSTDDSKSPKSFSKRMTSCLYSSSSRVNRVFS